MEYYIVWTTKYENKVLNRKIIEILRYIIRRVCNSEDLTILKESIGKEISIMSNKFIDFEISLTNKKKNIMSLIKST